MYNSFKKIPDIVLPPQNNPYEPSTIDFLELNFNQRFVVDITINRANNPPKIISISKGMFVYVLFAHDGKLYKTAGRISDITISECQKNFPNTTRIVPKPCGNKQIFIIKLDCSDRCESRIYDIASDDIRDISIFDPFKEDNENESNNNCCCKNCNCNITDDSGNQDNTTGTETPDDGSGEDISGDVDITPDTDLEDDTDFGTDPDLEVSTETATTI